MEKEMNDLITTVDIKPSDVFVSHGLDPLLASVREQIDGFDPDTSCAKGRKEIASMANKVARSKTLLDGLGKDLVSGKKAEIRVVDAERKRCRDLLDEWKVEVRQPLTDFENAKAKREEDLRKRLDTLSDLKEVTTGSTADAIQTRIDAAEETVIDEAWGDHQGLGQTTKEIVLEALQEKLVDRQAFEEQQAELEAQKAENKRLKLEADEREQKEREAKEEAERALREKADRERREKEEIEAREKAAEDARQEERRLIEAEETAKREAEEKRAADEEHRTSINDAAKIALVTFGLEAAIARTIIDAISDGKIPNVKITY
jgi:septal ring factor EnvC (AmiA/AmiB activator)